MERAGPGSLVRYVAVLEGRGLLRLASPFLARVFSSMAERAAAGLRTRVGMTPSRLAAVVDGALEATVVGSFSRAGYAVRSRLGHWRPPPDSPGASWS